MAQVIKMEYQLMEEMSRTFQRSAQQLERTMSEMQDIANCLQDGALLGRGGAGFTDAIRTKLCPAISRLDKKMEELQRDIVGAMNDMKQADQQSKGIIG